MNIDLISSKEAKTELSTDHGIIFDIIYFTTVFTSIVTFLFLNENGFTSFLYKIFNGYYVFRGLKIKYYNLFLGVSMFFSMWYLCITPIIKMLVILISLLILFLFSKKVLRSNLESITEGTISEQRDNKWFWRLKYKWLIEGELWLVSTIIIESL